MALEIYHQGRLLSVEQLQVYSDLLASGAFENLSIKRVTKLFDKKLDELGMGVPPLKKGDKVSWSLESIVDRGEILEVDDRTGKVKAMSTAKGRPVTVAQAYVRVEVSNG